MINKLFVYGTLRDPNSPDYIKDAEIEGELYTTGWYPFVSFEGENTIKGEVHLLGDSKEAVEKRLEELDGYEGVDSGLFTREKIEIDGEQCYIYVGGPLLSERSAPKITSGDWINANGSA